MMMNSSARYFSCYFSEFVLQQQHKNEKKLGKFLALKVFLIEQHQETISMTAETEIKNNLSTTLYLFDIMKVILHGAFPAKGNTYAEYSRSLHTDFKSTSTAAGFFLVDPRFHNMTDIV